MIWRVAASPRFASPLIEIETQWSLRDLLDANDVLDLYEDLESKAAGG